MAEGLGEDALPEPRDPAEFLAAWEQAEARYLAWLESLCARPGSWRERFRAAAADTMRLVEERPEAARVLVVEPIAFGELGHRQQRQLANRLAKLLDTAREELGESDAVPAATAHWILGIFYFRIHRRLSGYGPDLPSQLPELTFLAISCYFGVDAGLAELDALPRRAQP